MLQINSLPQSLTSLFIGHASTFRSNDFSGNMFRFVKNAGIPTPRFNGKNSFTIIAIIVLMLFSFFLGGKYFSKGNTTKDAREQAPVSKATQSINKAFNFSIKDDKGKEITKIKYTIQSAELDDEIIVKGQRARAVKGRTFLLLNIKLDNSYDKGIQINTRDYVRLTANGKDEKLAPDIHNDPVLVQAISTKLTRIGFPVSDVDKNLTLYVGEIDGSKETIKLNLNK